MLAKESREWVQKWLHIIRVSAVHVKYHDEMMIFLAARMVRLWKTGNLNPKFV